MIRFVQGTLYGTLSHLLTRRHNSKSILEQKDYLKMPFFLQDERKMNSTKSCPFVTDVSKGKMIFSKETSRAINEMGNLEVIELWQTSAKVQCLACLKKHVSEGLNMCQCGVCLRPNQITIDRIWATFAVLTKAILSYHSSLIKMEKNWT